MQQKRLSLALALSFLVLFGWNILFPPPPRVEPPAVDNALGSGTELATSIESDAPALDPSQLVSEPVEGTEAEEAMLVFGAPGERGHMRARFSNRGARLVDLRLGSYYDAVDLDDDAKADPIHWAKLTKAPELDDRVASAILSFGPSVQNDVLAPRPLDSVLWQMTPVGPGGSRGIDFRYAPGTGVVYEKRVRPIPDSYSLSIELVIENVAAPGARGKQQFTLVPAANVPRASIDKFYIEPAAIAVARGKKPFTRERDPRAKPEDAVGDLKLGDSPLEFVGVHNKYFALLLRGGDARSSEAVIGGRYRQAKLPDATMAGDGAAPSDDAYDTVQAEVDLALDVPAVGQRSSYAFQLYAGPKDRDELMAYDPNLKALIEKDLGFFDGIAGFLLKVLGFFHGITGNWGWAIILLTLSLRGLMFPITRRSQTAMARYQKKMKRVQPRLNELKEKYAKDPQKLRAEQGKIMQEERLFPPLGGCLPVFVQIPVFIGLFAALRTNFDLRHAPFMGWIRDLSMPDRLMRLDFNTHLPFIGTIEWLNVLPILMVFFWIWHTRSMPKPEEEQAARMQKMMMWMPLMMGFFLYNYAAGLSLYMITQSVLGIVETKVIKKLWPIDDTEKPAKKTGFMAKLAAAQQEQMKRLEAQQRAKQAGKGKGGKGGKGKRGGGGGPKRGPKPAR